jgi:hypothetical protein
MIASDLDRRRAQREADHLLEQIQTLINLIVAGELARDTGACLLHRAAGNLARLALNGELAA